MRECDVRTAMLLGEAAVEKLHKSCVMLVGLGGVGGHCAEALARSGVGTIIIADGDTIAQSNLNRQYVATKHNIGVAKTVAMEARLHEISDCNVITRQMFVLPDNIDALFADLPAVNYVLDCIDTITAKLALVKYAAMADVPIVSCMGMGNRVDPTQIKMCDVFSVTGCPVARVMRRELRRAGIASLDVCCSDEPPRVPLVQGEEGKSRTPASCAFVPSVAGIVMAGFTVRRLTEGI